MASDGTRIQTLTLTPMLSTAAHSIWGTEEALVIGYSIWQLVGVLQVPRMEGDCSHF